MSPADPGLRRDGFWHGHRERTRWGDQDAMGHINNVLFLRYLEGARIAYIGALCGAEGDSTGNVILADVQCSFRRQIRHPAELVIHSRTVRVGRSSLSIEQVMADADTGVDVATGASVMVWFDYRAQEPAPVPEWLREALRAREPERPEGL